MEQPTDNDHSLEQLVGLITLAIVIILVIIFWLIKPQVATLKDINAQVAAKNQELSATQQKLTSMNSLSGEIASKKDIVNRLNLVLPLNSPEVPDILLELSTLASTSSVDLKSFVPSGDATVSTSTEASDTTAVAQESILSVVPYEFNFTISGNYDAIKNFFNNLEKNLKTIKVKNVNISSSASGENPDLVATIIAETYYQQLPDASSNASEQVSETPL